jgi:hypothetical protein
MSFTCPVLIFRAKLTQISPYFPFPAAIELQKHVKREMQKMPHRSNAVIADHLIVAARLHYAFHEIERDARLLRWSLVFSGTGLMAMALVVLHHVFKWPALAFLWQLILSLCT